MNPKYKTNWGLISTLARGMYPSMAHGESVFDKVSRRTFAFADVESCLQVNDADVEIYLRVNDVERPIMSAISGNHADHPNLNEFLKC